LFGLEPVVDFEQKAQEVYFNSKNVWDNTVHLWNANRLMHTAPCEDLNAYVGCYECSDFRMTMNIRLHAQGEAVHNSASPDTSNCPFLRMQVNEMESQIFVLSHYHGDAWSFMPKSLDDALLGGYRSYFENWAAFVIYFKRNTGGVFVEVAWQLANNEGINPQVFRRVGG
jgi:hypothetical protein